MFVNGFVDLFVVEVVVVVDGFFVFWFDVGGVVDGVD